EEGLKKFAEQLTDRFGKIPKPTLELIDTIRLRTLAKEIGFEKLILKANRFTGYFVGNPKSSYYQSETFSKVLVYVQQHHHTCKIREKNEKLSLVLENIKNIEEAIRALKPLTNEVLV